MRFLQYIYRIRIIHLLGVVALLISACNGKKILGSNEYMQWVENPENGLKKEKKLGDFSYRAFLKPADYVVFREVINNSAGILDQVQVQNRIEALKDMYLFNFDVVSADGQVSALQYNSSGQEDYSSRINYFVSHAQQDFVLVQGKDTLACVLYHFEQTFGLSPLNTISLGFEKKNKESQDDIQLVFTNRLFNTGEIKFLFPESKLNSIPKLKL